MFKKLSLFFLSLAAVPVIGLGSLSNSKNSKDVIVTAIDDEPSVSPTSYTYTDRIEGNKVIRTFDDPSLAPTINKRFHAPSGVVLTLSLDDDLLNTWLDLFGEAGCNYDTSVIEDYYYTCFGSSIKVLENFYAVMDRENLFYALQYNLNHFELFQAREISRDTEVGVLYTIQLDVKTTIEGVEIEHFIFVFESDPVLLVPYAETDYIDIDVIFVDREGRGDPKINIFASPIPGFFNDGTCAQTDPDLAYNNYGFSTDEIYEKVYDPIKGFEGFRCKYSFELFAFDTIPLGSLIDGGHRIKDVVEMLYPNETLPIKAKLSFISDTGVEYTFCSKTLSIGNPKLGLLIDGYDDRDAVEVNAVHEFSFHASYIDFSIENEFDINISAAPFRLKDETNGVELYDGSDFPEVGETGKYYYKPSAEEIALYNEGKYDELDNMQAQGEYRLWDAEHQSYKPFELSIIDYHFPNETDTKCRNEFSNNVAMPYIGTYYFDCIVEGYNTLLYTSTKQQLMVLTPYDQPQEISLNVPNEVNLIQDEGPIEIVPTIEGAAGILVKHYYDFDLSRDDVVSVEQDLDGKLTVYPLTHGFVELTIYVESDIFSKISKTISIRVLDSVLGVSKVVVPNEFHYAGRDLTVSVSVRGFTGIQNLYVEWKVLDKKNKDVAENRYKINFDASITLNKAASDDYKVSAYYEGIEIGTVKFQVRKINVNEFVKTNIWWVVLITISFVVFVLFVQRILRGGMTTVQSIERVYNVYYDCISNDKLSLMDLKVIRRALKKCVRRCEDLNIESLNQYEKAIRYLRKSLIDTNSLIRKWENISIEDKSAFSEKLNADLSKALNVAREIESARELIDKYHMTANKKNYESISDEGAIFKKNRK